MRHTRGAVSEVDADGLIRRQKMTTWGILAFAVFVSVGMAEWSKRTAASETVIDPAVMKEAIKIAAARDSGVKGLRDSESGIRNSDLSGGSRVAGGGLPNLESGKQISDFGFRNSDSGKNLSDLGVSAVKSLATAEAQRRGGVVHSSGNDAATIQTSAGEQK